MAEGQRLSVVEEVGRQREKDQLARTTQRLLGDKIIEMDQEARDLATEAKNQIKAHEDVCALAWANNNKTLERMEQAIAKLQDAMDDRIGKIPASIIAALTGLVGFLAARAFPIH